MVRSSVALFEIPHIVVELGMTRGIRRRTGRSC
jgi:hypothetical protein